MVVVVQCTSLRSWIATFPVTRDRHQLIDFKRAWMVWWQVVVDTIRPSECSAYPAPTPFSFQPSTRLVTSRTVRSSWVRFAHNLTPCRCLRHSFMFAYFLRLPRCLCRERPRFTSLGSPNTSRIRQAMSVSLLLCFTIVTSSSRVMGKVLSSSNRAPTRERRIAADRREGKLSKQGRTQALGSASVCPRCEPGTWAIKKPHSGGWFCG